MKRSIIQLVIVSSFFMISIGCQKELAVIPYDPPDLDSVVPPPPDLGDGWTVSSLKAVGMNARKVQEMITEIESWQEHRFEGILIVKDGKLVFEKYYPGNNFNWEDITRYGAYTQFDVRTRHYLASGSKSVTSLLFGIAVDHGWIPNVDERITAYYDTEYPGVLVGNKRDITIRHLLSMKSGLSWDEWTPGSNDSYQLFRSADPIRFILSLPMQYTPGTRFHYNSGGTNILGDLIHQTSGLNLREFAGLYLFSPLRITDWEWKSIRGEDIFASGGLYMRPRDMARLGQLVLNKGSWQGRQIISRKWLEESFISRSVPDHAGLGNGYGYQWWLNDFESSEALYHVIFSAGWGEQFMFIFPHDNIIILFFGSYYFYGPDPSVRQLVERYLLKAFPCRSALIYDTKED